MKPPPRFRRVWLPVIALAAWPVAAQTPVQCGPVADVLRVLSERYTETPVANALSSDGRMLIITASPGGVWTAILVSAEGEACMAANGVALEVQRPEPPGVDG